MNNYDKDPILGHKVAEHLQSLGIDNPIKAPMDSLLVTQSIKDLIKGLGIIPDDDSIQKTPERVARFFVNELFYGLNYNNFPKITFNHNQYGYQEPVICEHHLVTISGEAFIAYIPKDNVIGLSKINRVVNFFARRPQVQERATLQIFHALAYILQTEDIALLIKASHHCITMRGVNDQNVENITYKFGGRFNEPEMKQEFRNLINTHRL